MKIAWEATGGTNTGRRRQNNEDSLLVDAEHGFFVVADGMGGHAGGEIASALAVQTAGEILARGGDAKAALREAVTRANAAIFDFAARNPRMRGMGTTLTACVLDPSGVMNLGHIGDSRAYRFRNGVLEQLTVDHTWVQREVDAGRISAQAARTHALSHVITQALGVDENDTPDILEDTALPGDLLLLCSDGLTGMVDDTQIAELLAVEAPLPELANTLIRTANVNGGVDNITVVLVRVLSGSS